MPTLPPYSELFNEVVQSFMTMSDCDMAINHVLGLVGSHLNVSRVYIFENSLSRPVFSNTYEWCAEGIPSYKKKRQRIKLSLLNGYYHFFDDNNIFAVSDISALPDYVCNILTKTGVKALLQEALVSDDQRVGMIGFEDCNNIRQWTTYEISVLNMLTKIMNTFILHQEVNCRSRLNSNILFKILNDLDLYVYAIDMETYNLLYVNEKVLNIIPEIEMGKPCYKFFMLNADKPCSFCPIARHKSHTDIIRASFDLFHPGFNMWVKIKTSKLKWFDGKEIFFICAVNISENRESLIRLSLFSNTNEITSLPNKRYFEEIGQSVVDSAMHREMNVAMVALEARMPLLRDHTSDKKNADILRLLARSINHILPYDSLFAHVKENRFFILYPYARQIGRDLLEKYVQKLCNTANQIHNSAALPGGLTLNAGISIYPEDGDSLNILCYKAEYALMTKPSERMSAFYNSVLAAEQIAADQLMHDLSRALEHNELEIYYQPLVDVRCSRVCGAEALLRWHHPDRGLLPGGAFLYAAETHNVLAKIDSWVLNEVCRHFNVLKELGCRLVPIAINISSDFFYQKNFFDIILKTLERNTLAANLVQFELTEELVLKDFAKSMIIMQRLQAMGIKIIIDDFGQNSSALNYLKHLPVDAVKIDRVFLAEERDIKARKIISLIVKIAEVLKATVIFEGIETVRQYQFAKESGCNIVQGYFTGRPGPLSTLTNRLSIEASRLVIPHLSWLDRFHNLVRSLS